MRLEVVWVARRRQAGRGWGGQCLHKAVGRGADKTGGTSRGTRVLSVLVHVWAVSPCDLAGGCRALAIEVHLLLVSLFGSILFVPLLM